MLGAQIYLTNELHSLSFDEKLTELGKPASARLAGVWWLPSPSGDVNLVLSNTTNRTLSASTTIRGKSPKREASTTVDLGPHETKVINIERDLLGRAQGAMSRFGAISVEHNGEPGALLARAMALDASLGYSLPIQFQDPFNAKSTNLQGAGLRIGKAGRESLSPVVVAHNAGETTSVLSGRVPYTTTGGTHGEITLPQVQLSPGETEVIDIAPYVKAHGVNGEVTVAGLECQYTGELGSIITSAFSVSRSGNQVFRVPLWDIAAQRSGTGGYPWYIAGDSSTVVYIKNVTDEIQSYRMYLKLTGGDYVFPLTTVAPRQTTVIDIRKLRDTQVPDVNGQTIPPGETRGQVQWSLTGGVDRVLIGRSEQVDVVRGISSNYACQNCCPNSFFEGFVTPLESTGFQGDEIQFIAMQQDQNCYGQVFPPTWAGFASYTSSDMSICNPDFSTGMTTGVGPGEALINAGWTTDAWFFSVGGCEYSPVEVLREAICDIVARRVDSVSPERALIGQPVDVTINGSGFGTGTPTINAGSGITVSDVHLINSGAVRARFTIATNAQGGNHAVSVTTSLGQATTINGNFFVQIPTRLRRDILAQTVVIDPGPGNVVSPFGVVTATNRCGAYRNVTYTLVDQQGQVILLAVPITETFDNYQGPPEIAPLDKTVFTLNGVIGDTLGLTGPHPTCPPAFSLSFNQRFRVDTNPSFQLSTVNSVSMSKSSSGGYTIAVNMTTP